MLRNRLDIEPLSTSSRERIRSAVFARLDEAAAREATDAPARLTTETVPNLKTWRWPVALGWTAVAAAAVLALAFLRPDRDPPDGALAGLSDTHSRVVTEASSSKLDLGDAELTVAAQSAVVVDRDRGGGVLVVLERGSVHCAVTPRPERATFRVQAGDVRIEVVGTVFAVYRSGDEARVEVERGTVKVLHQGEEILVEAGGSWASQAEDTAADVTDGQPADEHAARTERAHEPRRSRSERAHRRHRSDAARSTPDTQDMDDAALRAGEVAVGTPEPEAALEAPAGEEAVADEREAVVAEEPPAPTAKQRYEQAERLEATDPVRAISLYQDLVQEGGPWAPTALFAQARLELDRGRRAQARALLQTYLRRYPTGANAAMARRLLERSE
jgi:hypothetical protein